VEGKTDPLKKQRLCPNVKIKKFALWLKAEVCNCKPKARSVKVQIQTEIARRRKIPCRKKRANCKDKNRAMNLVFMKTRKAAIWRNNLVNIHGLTCKSKGKTDH
jgi:hypothetical protein